MLSVWPGTCAPATCRHRARSGQSSRPFARRAPGPAISASSVSAFILATMRPGLPRLPPGPIRRFFWRSGGCANENGASHSLCSFGSGCWLARCTNTPPCRSSARCRPSGGSGRYTGARCAGCNCRWTGGHNGAAGLAFAPGDQQHLGVGLQAHHAVHHLRAHRFQHSAQLMLASSSKRALSSTTAVTSLPRRTASRSRSINSSRTGAVNGLLDGQHLGVVTASRRKIQHAVKALVTAGGSARRPA
jgi:hypothetical protein